MQFLDLDSDGWLDVFVTNGTVRALERLGPGDHPRAVEAETRMGVH